MKINKCTSILFVFLFLFAGAIGAWSQSYFSLNLGLIFLGNAEEDSAPNPVILQGIGATFPVYQIDAITIEIGGLFYGTQYQWANNRASPADIERADNFFVLSTQIDGRVTYEWRLSDQVGMGVGGGLSLVIRIPLFAYDNGEQYRSDMTSYFFEMARFLYPRGDFFVDWAIVEGLGLRFSIQALVPIYNLWSGEGVPFWDGGMIQGIVSLRFLL
ncbi:MAG: hypothetical protein JW822_12720 [Spirochaetales bacterium]|nr:hypothetical protein [Spirochaetales bacterium]